jgi:carboxymethylenebutenolidase
MPTTQNVHMPGSGGRRMHGALALPKGEGRRPGVIVIHEAFGLNRDIRRIAARIAGLGYVALAPDLYRGRGPKVLCIARTMRTLNRGAGPAFEDLEAARQWLAARPEVDESRMGVIGFCMGGGFALLLAARAPMGAAGVFYGAVPKERDEIDGVCPVVAGYGGRDRVFAPMAGRLRAHLESLGVDHDIVVYPDAGHSYMSPHRGPITKLMSWGPMKVAYNEAAAEDSWRRIEAFFARHLG